MTEPSRRATLLLTALSALLAAACFPPLDLGLLAWIAWVPWLVAISRGVTMRDAVLAGALHSVVLHAPQCWWMVQLMRSHAGLPLPAALGMYAFGLLTVAPYGIAVAVATRALAGRRGSWALLAAPFVSAGIDVLRCRMTFGFPWLVPGMTQSRHPAVMGIADVFGVHGLSALVLLGNALVAALVLLVLGREPARRALGVAAVSAALVAASLLYGAAGLRRHAAPGALAWTVELENASSAPPPRWPEGMTRVAVVQGSQPQDVKVRSTDEDDVRLARVQLELNALALGQGAQAIVWSESSHPDTTEGMPALLASVQGQLRGSDKALRPEVVVGAVVVERPPDGRRPELTNSALLVDAGGRLGRYDKIRLVPFGEYLPWGAVFSWFPQVVRVAGRFRSGASEEPLRGHHFAYGAVVCYEIVLPQCVRAVARSGGDVIVNLTNDGWYHGTWMPEQHLRFASLRAVETRRFVIRAANSGISAIVAPTGRIVGRMEEGRRGLLLGGVDRRDVRTPYVRWGDLPVALLAAAALLWAAAEGVRWRPWRRSRRGSGAAGEGTP